DIGARNVCNNAISHCDPKSREPCLDIADVNLAFTLGATVRDELICYFVDTRAAPPLLNAGDVLIDGVIDTDRVRLQLFMNLRDQARRIEQRVGRRSEHIRRAQRIFGQSSIDVRCSVPEIFAADFFGLDKRLGGFTRLEIFPYPFPTDIVSGEFESVLSVRTFTHYPQRVQSAAFSSYDSK